MLKVNDSELKGDPINCLRLDRTGKQLVVLARDNSIRLFDTDRCVWHLTIRYACTQCWRVTI